MPARPLTISCQDDGLGYTSQLCSLRPASRSVTGFLTSQRAPGKAAILAASRVGASGKVIGIDVSRPMLGVAAAKIAQRPIALLQMDAQALAFKDESFDAVVCQLGLMFLPDAIRALQEWTRVLRSRGHLAVCVWASPDRVPLFGILMDELSRHLPDQRDVLYQPSALADAEILGATTGGSGLEGRSCDAGRLVSIGSRRSTNTGSRLRRGADATGSCT